MSRRLHNAAGLRLGPATLAMVLGCAAWAASPPATGSGAPAVAATTANAPLAWAEAGTGNFRFVPGTGPVLGGSGRLLRFRVAVEEGIAGVTPAAFAAEIVKVLGDPRSWIAGDVRLQRVGRQTPADFTLYLATPKTRDRLCWDGDDLYTSCRRGKDVVINVARWALGVPDYGAGLAVYRGYVIDHEVGHVLGHGHELCPGPGRPAPVMEQQTLGLHGCTPNPWPYLDGRRYRGPPGAYHDPVPQPLWKSAAGSSGGGHSLKSSNRKEGE